MSTSVSLSPTVSTPRQPAGSGRLSPLFASWWRLWLAAPSRDGAWIR